MWVRGFIAAVFILCSPFTFQVVGCPRLTTWSGYSSHLWRSLKLWVYKWLRPLYYFLFTGIGFYWILLFSPAPLQKTWTPFCFWPPGSKFAIFPIIITCMIFFGISHCSSMQERIPFSSPYMKIWGSIYREPRDSDFFFLLCS